MSPRREPPPGSLVLVRHGETPWSRSGQHTGLTDIALTDRGVALAGRLPELLAAYRLVAVLCSPLQRARRTAELAGLAAVPGLELEPDLVEWDYGGYEGITTPDIRARLGYDWEIFRDGVVPGSTPGETLQQVAVRLRRVIDRVTPLLYDGDVAVVSHGHALRVLATVWLGQAPQLAAQLDLDAGSVSSLGFVREIPVVLTWNRTP